MLHRVMKQQLRFGGVSILSPGSRMDSDDSKSIDESVNESVNESDDSKSTTSTMSASVRPEICPCCKKQLQARAMFNHMRKFHPDYIKSLYSVWGKKLDEMITTNAPMPIDWTVKDDFDEEELRTVWGCLACDNTFTTEQNAKKHCNAKCKKDHNAELKRFKKEDEKERKESEKKMGKERLRWINRTPQQIYMCIQQEITFHNKKWVNVSAKVVQFMQSMNRIYNETYDYDKYVFTAIPLPAFENNKENMQKEERRIDREISNWIHLYKDSLRTFWGDHQIVSDAEYESLEKNICWTNDYPELKF